MAFSLFSFGKEKTLDELLADALSKGKPINTVSLQGFIETYEALKKFMNNYTTDAEINDVIRVASTKSEMYALERKEILKRKALLNDFADEMEARREAFFQATNRMNRSIGINTKLKEKLGTKAYEFDMLVRNQIRNIRLAAGKYSKGIQEKPLTLNEKFMMVPPPPSHPPGSTKGGRSKKTRKQRSALRRKQTRRR